MTVKELKEMLNKYPDDMEVVNGRCSDYQVISLYEWSTVKAVPYEGGTWLMRSHPTMSEEHKKNEKEYLYL